ncbi:Gfo/Idh/MocA family oxidoreductase [Microlunatus panaciterrae]
MATSPKRYAIVGTGSRADMYINALLTTHADVGRPVALCDTNSVRMALYNTKITEHGQEAAATYDAADFGRLLDEQRPDGVIVTSPDYTHSDYICAALDRDIDVISEKPMTTTADRIESIVESVRRSKGTLVVTFNYRYSPRNSTLRQLIAEGAIGDVTSMHFEWVLDTSHGADYFRRWHREKSNSGGLLVHKSTHHFDLINWWLDDVPQTVFALGGLRFYGDKNAAERGLGARPLLSRDTDPATDPFHLDLAADDKLRRLYLDAEHVDGYHRDQDVFAPGITIEDNLSLLVGFRGGPSLSYSLNAHAPWEGYRVGVNGTAGRLELEVIERSSVPAAAVRGSNADVAPVVDPSAQPDEATSGDEELRPVGARILLQKHWESAVEVPIPEGAGSHGGGDAMLLDDVFRGATEDPLRRAAGYLDGIRSVLVGVSGNQSLATGEPVHLSDFGLPLTEEEAV